MNIVRKARGTKFPKQAQRVFLCYNEHNSTGRDEIISDLLSMDSGMDCVVSYLEHPDIAFDEKELRDELSKTQLLVVWVTIEMLQSVTKEMLPIEYHIAQKLYIPILPILSDNGLFSLYNERFVSIHCITKLDSEYRYKLKTQLEICLASEKIIEQIRKKAFTSAVFMSYRRDDIEVAQNFMKTFHDWEGFESISIWYDDFLTAGENFDDVIKELIHDSAALVLVVTPTLTTKGNEAKRNYVQEIEYPFAQKIGKSVISVEVLPTSQIHFFSLFRGAENPTPLNNTIELQKIFRDKLGESTFAKQWDSERTYLLGMAYLKGIDVERDFDRAVKLLATATEDWTESSIDAANQLAGIYENGIGVGIAFDKALKWYRRASAICEKIPGITAHQNTAIFYSNIATVYYCQGKFSNALEWYQKALDIREKIFGKKHPDTATIYNNIASACNKQGKYAKALSWYEQVLVIREKALGKEHSDTATIYHNIASIHNKQGEYSEALLLYEQALAIYEKVFGKEHPATATTYNNIAGVYYYLRRYSKAILWYNKALAIYEKVLCKEHPSIATVYNSIAIVYDHKGDYSKALELYEKALAIREKILGKKHPDTATTYSSIAFVYNKQGSYSKALELCEKALAICEEALGLKHSATATACNNIALMYDSQGEYIKSLSWYKKALTIFEKALGREHPDTAIILNNIAGVYIKLKGNI